MMLRKLAATGFAMLALAGCNGAPGGATEAGASPTPSSNQAAAIVLAECMRANGFPNFPDPVKDDQGRWNFPAETAGDWLPPDACRPLVRDWKSVFADEKPLTADDMAKLREYAKCMREHGLPDFPDPDDDGNFEVPDRLRVLAENNDPVVTATIEACEHLLPPKKAGK
jgi:hypothetical protein